jgi:hypothetical protein
MAVKVAEAGKVGQVVRAEMAVLVVEIVKEALMEDVGVKAALVAKAAKRAMVAMQMMWK